MKKIAMLNCLKANDVCSGAACLRAFNQRTASFERYGEEELELVAFMRCNGCKGAPANDAGMAQKLQRLVSIGTQVLHVGVCTQTKEKEECALITGMLQTLQAQGIQVVRGTHH